MIWNFTFLFQIIPNSNIAKNYQKLRCRLLARSARGIASQSSGDSIAGSEDFVLSIIWHQVKPLWPRLKSLTQLLRLHHILPKSHRERSAQHGRSWAPDQKLTTLRQFRHHPSAEMPLAVCKIWKNLKETGVLKHAKAIQNLPKLQYGNPIEGKLLISFFPPANTDKNPTRFGFCHWWVANIGTPSDKVVSCTKAVSSFSK